MSRNTTSTARRVTGLAEKIVLGFVAGAAVSIGVLSLVFLVLRIVDVATAAETTLFGAMVAEPLTTTFASPAVVSVTSAAPDVTVRALPDAARAALIGADLTGSLAPIGVCAMLAWLCLRVFVGKPFVRSATLGIGVVAILVLIAGLAAPLLTGIAHAETAAHFGIDELVPFLVVIDPAPIGWSIALAIVAGAFEIGQRLQRDTEGLV